MYEEILVGFSPHSVTDNRTNGIGDRIELLFTLAHLAMNGVLASLPCDCRCVCMYVGTFQHCEKNFKKTIARKFNKLCTLQKHG